MITYEQVSEKIQSSFNDCNFRSPHRALKAIVDLHKPNSDNNCQYCTKVVDAIPVFIGYPCLTIQILDKELK